MDPRISNSSILCPHKLRNHITSDADIIIISHYFASSVLPLH